VTEEPTHHRPLKRHEVLVVLGGAVSWVLGQSNSIAVAIAIDSSSVGVGETLCCIVRKSL
jgi:hypothetical protein